MKERQTRSSRSQAENPWSAVSLARPMRSETVTPAPSCGCGKEALHGPDRVGLASEAALHGFS